MLISFYTFERLQSKISNNSRYFQIQLKYRSFFKLQLMFFNSRSNNVKDNDRGKSVGCNIFSFTGVRFFQPKFMDSLNQPSVPQSGLSKYRKDSKPDQKKYPQNSKLQDKRVTKQNIDPAYSTFKYKKSEITFKKKQIEVKICRIRGLNNIGNTCYMNSMLQCLLNLSRFNSAFSSQVAQTKKNNLEVTFQYKHLIQQFIETLTSSSFTPSKLKSQIGKKKCRFLGTAQQDAQQFLTAILETLNEEMSRVKQKPKYVELQNDPNIKPIEELSGEWWDYYKKRDDSIVCDYFQGQLISTVTCKKCKNQSVTFDTIWGLPLSLTKASYSISELIRNNWNIENQISDYYCGKCKKHRDCTKKLQFFKLPEILIIQLKRFEYGKWKKEKIKTAVKLSDTLSLSECLHKDAQNQNHLYKLSSLVHHYGEVDYGHYTASVHKQNEKKWYLLNDSKTSQNIPDSPSSTVYLAFYEKVLK